MNKVRLIISILLSVCFVFSGNVFAIAADEYVDVTKYSYSVVPVLAPFNCVLYVKTDNPDPLSFRLYDKDSCYYEPDTDNSDIPCFELYDSHFPDVKYENYDTYRVNGGYIFYCPDFCCDGGEMIVQQKVGEGGGTTVITAGGGSYSTHDGQFEDTAIKVQCSKLESGADYLVENIASEYDDFFDKMDAVQSFLDSYAVYPFGVYDDSKPTGMYPCLAASRYYPELSLNTHCELVYSDGGDMLLDIAYPFVLDSASFPGLMSSVAKKLEPTVEIEAGGSHPYIEVSFEGQSKLYGGAGAGGYENVVSSKITASYTFKFDDSDYSKEQSLDKYKEDLFKYKAIAQVDAEKLNDLIDGDTYEKTITETGGTFIKILTEGFITGRSYAYVMPGRYGNIIALSNTWVKGRYISEYEYLYTGCKFEDFPNANILVDDFTYTDKNGQQHTEDVLFRYDETNDNWSAESYYGYTWNDEKVPDEFFLSREQVVEMGVDRNGGILPESGLVYDGSAQPGTPFENVLVQGVSMPDAIEVAVGGKSSITADIVPSDAEEKYCIWESSNEDIVAVTNEDDEICYIRGIAEGTATVKVMTFDGRYTAECLVTVTPANILGDVNGDGKINVSDARLALRAAVKIENYAEGSAEFLSGDVDFDNSITVSDARLILRVAVELDDPKDWLK